MDEVGVSEGTELEDYCSHEDNRNRTEEEERIVKGVL